MKKQFLILFLKYGLGLGLLVGVIWYNRRDLAEVFERPAHWSFLACATMAALASVSLTLVRWYVLVRAQELPFTLPSALRLGMVGFYYNTLLPGSVGGDIIKAACIAREQSRRTVAVTTVIMDRAIGLCGLIWLVALVGVVFWATGLLPRIAGDSNSVNVLETISLGAAGLMAGSIAFWVLLGCLSQDRADRLGRWLSGIPKIGGALAELWRAGWLYRCRGRSVSLALGMAMLGHIGFILIFYCSSRTLNPPENIPSLEAHILIVPVGVAVAAGIPTPGGVGGGEFIFGELYKILGFSSAAGVLASLMQRCIYWALGIVGYIIYLRMKPELAAAVTPIPPVPATPELTVSKLAS